MLIDAAALAVKGIATKVNVKCVISATQKLLEGCP